MSTMLARVAFYPTLMYNVFMEKFSSRQWYTRMDDTVILGALPFRGMTQQLAEEENVRGVVTLNEEYETKYLCNTAEEWSNAGIKQLCLPTTDLTAAPTQDSLVAGVKFIFDYRQQGSSVYVHCKAGRTRSAAMVACYLIQLHKWTPQQAVEYIKERRSHIIIRQAQWDALEEFYSTTKASAEDG